MVTKVVLSLAHGGTMFIAVAALVTMTIGHTEHVETLLYLSTFVLLLPCAAIVAHYQLTLSPRLDISALLAGVNLAALSGLLILGRLLFEIGGSSALRVVFLVGAGLIALGNWATTRTMRLSLQTRRIPRFVSTIPAVLVVGTLMLFVPRGSLTPLHLGLSIGLGIVIALILMAAPVGRMWRRVVIGLDVIIALIVVPLLASDVNQYHGSFHRDQDFHLGPANAILHGSPMLVDTFSQYGVGVMYFLAGVFKIVPIGYGSFQLVNGVLTALEFVCIYAVLRIGCRSQFCAVLGTAVCLVANVHTGIGPHVGFASTGPLRFGLPWLLIALAILAAAKPARRRSLGVVMLAVVGVSALWSFEAFVYTTGTYLAVVALELAFGKERGRERTMRYGRQLAVLASVIVASHVAFAVATRVLAGAWPDWGGYLAYIRLYGWIGFFTLPIEPWSLGYLVAGVYFVSAAGLAFVVLEQKGFASSKRVEITAIATTTMFGLLSYTYFLGRSHPNNLHHIAPSAIVLSVLWVSLLNARSVVLRRTVRFAALVIVGWAAAAIIVQKPQQTGESLLRSPLRQSVQLHPSLIARAHALIDWRQRPEDPRAVESEELLDRFAPGESRVAVVVQADVATEVLIRAHRGNLLPIAVPKQDALLPARSLSLVRERLTRLRLGGVVLTEDKYLANPGLRHPVSPESDEFGDDFARSVLSEILHRFRYRVVATTSDGLVLLRLEARRILSRG